MHQINARAKEKHWSKKKGTTKKREGAKEKKKKTNIHKTEKKTKLLSFFFIYSNVYHKMFSSICFCKKSILRSCCC
jgi:hypothetical protein